MELSKDRQNSCLLPVPLILPFIKRKNGTEKNARLQKRPFFEVNESLRIWDR
jgi:hypothetical protein